jgi:hypothetical protein
MEEVKISNIQLIPFKRSTYMIIVGQFIRDLSNPSTYLMCTYHNVISLYTTS